MTDESSLAPVPSTLGRYRILRRLGQGGMAEVFLARATGAEGIEKLLVVKRVLPSFAKSARFISMFTAEAKVAVRLNHPNIVQVYGFEQVGEQFLLAMEYVDGLDLGGLLHACRAKRVRMPHAIAAFVAMELAKGLDYAHNRHDDDGVPLEIVHRDVSPQNVLITAEGVVKIADFGVAKARRLSEEPGVLKGKVGYMSPEQARGESVDRRSDVYSLGVVLAELLLGHSVYPKGEQLALLEQVRRADLPLPRPLSPTVPEDLEHIVRRATARDPEERFQSARSFAGSLAKFLHMQEEICDAETLERFLNKVVALEASPPPPPALSPTVTLASQAEEPVRDHRPVVVVSGKLHVEGGMPGDDARLRAWLTRILGDMAYKTDAALTWPNGDAVDHFRFILGLGAPSLHDPLTACRLALDVGEALEGLSADLVSSLSASFGVSRGVLRTSRDGRGRLLDLEPADDVIAVADGLASARTGVMASGEIFRLVRRVYAFGEAVDGVRVDGEGPESLHAVRGHPLVGARTREERAAEIGAVGPLVGREREQDKLRAAHARAVRTHRTVFVAVTGELGVGKTALVAATLRELDPPARILRTEGAFATMEVPFAATAELVREACGIDDDTSPSECRRRLEQACAELIGDPQRRQMVVEGLQSLLSPLEGGEGDGGHPDPERPARIKRAVGHLISALAERSPVAVWVDALQWVDAPSMDVMRQMLQRSYPSPVLAVLSGRPEPRIAPLLDAVPPIRVSELEAEEDRRALVRRGFDGAEVPDDVMDAILERAGGNPFFLLELVDALLERDEVAVETTGTRRHVVPRSSAPFSLPATVQGVIETRLGELGSRERTAARWLAVMGPGTRAADLSALAGVDLAPALEDLAARGLVTRAAAGAYGFPNAVIRHVAYATSHPDERARMHRRAAAFLREMGRRAAPAQVAHHLEHAGDHVGAADAYLDAARAAERTFSHADAHRLYGRALKLLHPESTQRFWAHAAREELLRRMGHHGARRDELEAMEAMLAVQSEPTLVTTHHLRHARWALDTGDPEGAAASLSKARAQRVEDRGVELGLMALEARCHAAQGRSGDALAACDRALARAGMGSQWLPWRGRALVERSRVLAGLGRGDEAAEAAAEAWVLFRRLGTPLDEGTALAALGMALGAQGQVADAVHALRASLGVAGHTGDRTEARDRVESLAHLYERLGRPEAAASLREGLDQPGGR